MQEYKYPLYFARFILFNNVRHHFTSIRQFRKLTFESSYNIDQKVCIILYMCFKALHFHVISCLQSLRFIVLHSNRNSCFCIFLSLLRMCWHFYSLLFILVKSYDQDKLKWSMAQICGCRYFSFKHDTISVWKMWHSSNYEMYDLQQTSICLYQLIIKRSVSSTLERWVYLVSSIPTRL